MKLFIFYLTFAVFCTEAFAISSADAKKQRKPVKTNINKVSVEFDQIRDRDNLEESVLKYRQKGTNSFNNIEVREILNPTNNPEGIQDIDPHSLESMGRSKRGQNSFFNDFEVDYTKPGVSKHKNDIKQIITATDKKILDLTKSLRKHGIDCNEEDIKTPPSSPYYIEIEEEHHKEVDYNQHFCEQVVDTYNCHDSMSVTCQSKSMNWGDWKVKHLKIPGFELMHSGFPVFYSEHVADSVFEFKMYSSNSAIFLFNSVPGMKGYLAKKHNVTRDHIDDDMHLSWEGGVSGVSGDSYMGRILGGKDYVWNTYNVTYRIRDGEEICTKWSEEKWVESCLIK